MYPWFSSMILISVSVRLGSIDVASAWCTVPTHRSSLPFLEGNALQEANKFIHLTNRRRKCSIACSLSSNDNDETSNNESKDEGSTSDPSTDESAFVNCDEEGECEIDWDSMPGFETDDEEVGVESGSKLKEELVPEVTSAMDDFVRVGSNHMVVDDDEKIEYETVPSADQLRTRFEMQWQMTEQTEECDVYKPVSCGGNPCTACNGKGTCTCRFCRGVGFIYMKLPSAATVPQSRGEQLQKQYEESMWGGSLNSLLQTEPSTSFTSCSVCQQNGFETCRQCRGSGWIADWTNVDIHADMKP